MSKTIEIVANCSNIASPQLSLLRRRARRRDGEMQHKCEQQGSSSHRIPLSVRSIFIDDAQWPFTDRSFAKRTDAQRMPAVQVMIVQIECLLTRRQLDRLLLAD